MVAKIMIIAGAGALLVAGAGGVAAFTLGRIAAPPVKTLIGDDLGQVRRDALAMFPRGQAAAAVKERLTAMGFQCTPLNRLMPNINAPVVQCDSAGRNFPVAARISVTVMARNGEVADIAVGNGDESLEANARTPDPNPGGSRHAAATPTATAAPAEEH